MVEWGIFSHIETLADARKAIVYDYGPTCEVPFAYFLPEYENQDETKTLKEHQKPIYYNRIKSEVLELRELVKVAKSIEDHTWIYSLGFRAGLNGRIVNPSIEWQIKNQKYPSSWLILGKRLGVFNQQNSVETLIQDILNSPLISDFEQGINYIFKPEDITGAGSDALDPEGRIRLRDYFGLAKYCENLNQKLVDYFFDIRKLNPKS